MLCLGIESTAHTFGCSIVRLKDGHGEILSECRDIYKAPPGSGIHPRDASRHHGEFSNFVLKNALGSAKISINEIDVIAYSAGPGLGPCLRVGAVIARTLSSYYGIPLVPVNHALGHIELSIMLTGAIDPLVLLVSGGHTMILVFSYRRWRVFGETLDITIGQLFDQFGRNLGLSSPCGKIIEENAKRSSGTFYNLPYNIKGNDVSFSGLLTACTRLIKDNDKNIDDICFSLQETSFAILAEAVERALSFTEKKNLLVVGGVIANRRLSEMLQGLCIRQNVNLFLCPYDLAGDNGAQIAWTGIMEYMHGRIIDPSRAFVNQAWRLDTIDILWR